jgi:hypothetical protein
MATRRIRPMHGHVKLRKQLCRHPPGSFSLVNHVTSELHGHQCKHVHLFREYRQPHVNHRIVTHRSARTLPDVALRKLANYHIALEHSGKTTYLITLIIFFVIKQYSMQQFLLSYPPLSAK